MKKPLHKRLLHNWALKVLAVAIALALWVLVTRGVTQL
jgi:hypothetical protein